MLLPLAGPSTFGMNAGWLGQTCHQSTAGGRHWMPPARKKAKVRDIRDGLEQEQGGSEAGGK